MQLYRFLISAKGGNRRMFVFILACIVSFVPCIALYLWLRKNGGGTGEEGRTEFKAICKKTLVQGILTLFPVVLLSGVSYVLLRLTGLQNTNPLLYQALYTFGVLALMEELAKYLTFRRVLKKTDSQYSWLDITILMTIVGIGFGLIESILYLFGASVPVVELDCRENRGCGALQAGDAGFPDLQNQGDRQCRRDVRSQGGRGEKAAAF